MHEDVNKEMPIQEMFLLGMKRTVPYLRHPYSVPTPALCEHAVMLNVGAGEAVIPNHIPVDLPEYDADTMPLPYAADTVTVIQAYHFMEHVKDPMSVLRDFERVLVTGGIINIGVPFGTCEAAVQDLDHKNFFTETSWQRALGNSYYRDKKHGGAWYLFIRCQFIMGIVGRNLMLFTQFQKGRTIGGHQENVFEVK